MRCLILSMDPRLIPVVIVTLQAQLLCSLQLSVFGTDFYKINTHSPPVLPDKPPSHTLPAQIPAF